MDPEEEDREAFWEVGTLATQDEYHEEEEEDEESHINPYRGILESIIFEVNRRQQYWDLAGGEGPSPYAELENALTEALDEVRMLREHQCEWSSDDYCLICGADGRA